MQEKTIKREPGFIKRHLGKKCPKCQKRGYSTLTKIPILRKASTATTYLPFVSRYRTSSLVIGIRKDEYFCINCKQSYTEQHRTFEG